MSDANLMLLFGFMRSCYKTSLIRHCSERWGGSVRDRGTLLCSGRGVRLLWRPTEGASCVDDILRPDGSLRVGPPHPAAHAHPALQMRKPER